MLVSYTWLQEYLGDAAPSPDEVVDLLTRHAFEIEGVEQVGGDTIIDIDVLPNRSSDCLSHRGIAREIATITGQTLAYDPLAQEPELPLLQADEVSVTIADKTACPRFTAVLMRDIKVGPSPAWLQERLRALGQRPINNIVDATNYVMYGMGQPLHVYDAERFPMTDGTYQFGVRAGRVDEQVALLAEGGRDEERTVTLTGTELVITDAANDTPVGLAGVKGGTFAGVRDNTRHILIEAANFHPITTRQTARKLGIVIDASRRFENDLSPALPPYAQAEIVRLLQDIAGGTVVGLHDTYPAPRDVPTIVLDPVRVNKLLGLSIPVEEMVMLLERAGVTVTPADDMLHCVGPEERTDLCIPEDLIEEIGRLYGYEHVPSTLPDKVLLNEVNALQYYSEQLREALQNEGFSEVITSSFRKKDAVRLRNALASDKGCLRSSLQKNLAEVLLKNAPHTDLLGTNDTRVFEIGTVFDKTETGVTERVTLCLGVQVRASGYTGKEDRIIESAKQAVANVIGDDVAWQGKNGVVECDLTEAVAALPTPDAYVPVTATPDVTYQPFSVYPAISRDIALWVPDDTSVTEVAEQILSVVAETDNVKSWEPAGAMLSLPVQSDIDTSLQLKRLDLFDTFHKDGRTSYAFRLVFQSDEHTLTDEVISPVTDSIYQMIADQGWEAR